MLPESRWSLRDFLAAAALFASTAGVVLWQNAHVAVLWDLSYVLDSATRIADGQVPYRDFPLAHAPLTFLIQAVILKLTGRVFFHHVLYAAIAGGLGTVVTWRIVLHTLSRRPSPAAWSVAVWPVALLVAAPLAVLGIYCILPLPSYDCDCALAILAAIYLLQRLQPPALPAFSPNAPTAASGPQTLPLRALIQAVATGASLCLPLFFKQNIGLPFLAAACALLLLALAAPYIDRTASGARSAWTPLLLAVLAGVAATLLAALLVLHSTVGLGNYIHWTIGFAAQRRLPGLAQMIGVYHDPSLLWTLPCVAAALILLRSPLAGKRWAQVAAFALLAAPSVYVLSSLFLYDDADERGDSLLAVWPLLLILATVLALGNLRTFRRAVSFAPFLPLLLLVAINGTLMSQQLWGSTYAIWPLLIILIAEMIAYLAGKAPTLGLAVAAAISIALLVCGGFYTASEERLSYAQLPDGPVQHSAFPQLKGMAVAGPWLPNFDELLRYAAVHIPPSDGLLLLPGEDPFYFVSGRVPQFPVLLFDPATDPYSPAQLEDEVRGRGIRWLIVKRDLQLTADPTPQREETMKLLLQEFALAARLRGYDVYERRGMAPVSSRIPEP